MLKVSHLTVEYEGKPVVSDVSLQIGKGQIVSLVGESGSGKTTVLRTVFGLLPKAAVIRHGDVTLDDQQLLSYTPAQWRNLHGSEFSMIFQDSGAMLNPIRRIGSQFDEYLRTHEKMSRTEARKREEELLRNVCLKDTKRILRSYPFQLSGGMRQRVGIAMALAFQPRLLLADEPTSALDVTTQAQIVQQMMQMRSELNMSILLVTHNIGVAAYMSDHIIVMKDGKIVEEGSREEILNHPKADYTRALLNAVPILGGERYV